jgi:hypothetical protein
MIRNEKTPGRNAPCPCGSGKKAKKCCLAAIKVLASVPPQLRRAFIAAQLLDRGKQPQPPVVMPTPTAIPVVKPVPLPFSTGTGEGQTTTDSYTVTCDKGATAE